MAKGNLFVVTAPSGAGKTTLVAALLAADSQVQLSISFTTRPPRAGEVDGKDYHFVDRVEFERMIAAGELLEFAEVYGNYYGTSQVWINQVMENGRDILLEIDWQGAQQVRRIFPNAIGIFILPPCIDTLENRLRGRGKDSEEVIARRMAVAKEEVNHVDEFDYVIVNEHIDDAVRDIVAVVRAQRLTLVRQSNRHTALISSLKG
ncbi:MULTISPECIES: guanylate kinase [Deefgea]|uniref:Guanylate kinase n=1 Tax=Deefgea chitinilytica TaxID=570276 RepID=A0ABS2CBH7_9NEIS|nr:MULTISPECIES: guanylate kinase [Deefgea]MBM5571496.1 guanylate kinase [Deefgea chitinilytica]MBM9888729.1 guanylate kinase [Deefgea sp. CFH1-16]